MLFAVARLLEHKHGPDYGYAQLLRKNAHAIRDITDDMQTWVKTEQRKGTKVLESNKKESAPRTQSPRFVDDDLANTLFAREGADALFAAADLFESEGDISSAKQFRQNAHAIYDLTDKVRAQIAHTHQPEALNRRGRIRPRRETLP